MSIAQLNSKVNIYYEVHGKGEPLILINGLKSDHTGWAPILEELAKSFMVVLLDNRAIGKTNDDGGGFSIEDMAGDVIRLMDYLKISKAHIAGHSMGGAIVQVLAHNYPSRVNTVFLCNTFIKFNKKAAKAFGDISTLFQKNVSRRKVMEEVIPWVFSKSVDTPEFREQIFNFIETDPSWQTAYDYERQLNALNAFDSSEWVEQINVPTVVVGSNEDITALVEESKAINEAITGSVLEVLPGGHASAVEQPNALLEVFYKYIPK